jgi:predicted transcriptional regulator
MSQNAYGPQKVHLEHPSVTELFHRLNSVLPDNQKIVPVLPETPVQEALDLLNKHGFSQSPVMVGHQVLGLFSYRSFSRTVIKLSGEVNNNRFNPQELFVEDCLDKPSYQVHEETATRHRVVL